MTAKTAFSSSPIKWSTATVALWPDKMGKCSQMHELRWLAKELNCLKKMQNVSVLYNQSYSALQLYQTSD